MVILNVIVKYNNMKNYKITIELDLPGYNGEHTSTWNGYDEAQAIAQAFLSYGYAGARSLKVIEITEN